MARFVPFDERIIKDEFWKLSTADFLDLTEAMKMFQRETGVGYTIDNYGEVMMIKGGRQGRGVFFTLMKGELVLLSVYKPSFGRSQFSKGFAAFCGSPAFLDTKV